MGKGRGGFRWGSGKMGEENGKEKRKRSDDRKCVCCSQATPLRPSKIGVSYVIESIAFGEFAKS